jgi:hypothetical protein
MMPIFNSLQDQYISRTARTVVNVSHWVADRFESYHNHHVLKHDVDNLRHMDRHMLVDMGIDLAALHDTHPRIEQVETKEFPSDDDEHSEAIDGHTWAKPTHLGKGH